MNTQQIEEIVILSLSNYIQNKGIQMKIDKDTPLIGSHSIIDSLGLVHLIVDIETAFLDENIELSLTSESAMSSKVSPFRSVGSICNFIAKQLNMRENG
jgi:acyl carrier protein